MSDYSIEFFQSMCDTPLKRKIVEVLENPDLTEDEKIQTLVEYIREVATK